MNTVFNRRHHAFLSYSHKDRDLAVGLHRWLTNVAGFDIWFDENHLEVGTPVAKSLTENMSDCRAWIVLVSKNSIGSNYVAKERDEALDCNADNSDFSLIILHIDDCPLKEQWPSIKRFSWLEMPNGALTSQVAREIINRLDGRRWSGKQSGLRDVYVSHGWRPTDLVFADAVCNGFCDHKWMLRLIGDMPDQKTFDETRVREILAQCWGHIVILPRRTPTEKDYRYFTRELTISANLGIPTVLIAEADTPLPASLDASVNRLLPNEEYHNLWLNEPPGWLEGFIDELKKPLAPKHVFLAAEYKENVLRTTNLQDFIEVVTGMPCHVGRDFEGQGLRDQIVSSIVSSSLVVANIATFEESASFNTAINLNTCVEAGIALGASGARVNAGNNTIQVLLTAQSPLEMKGRTAQLPFMFRDSQITWYSDEVELLGHCRRLLQPYRRRVINFEIDKTI